MTTQEPCTCTVNMRTGEIVDRQVDCPQHGTGEGFYVVNVSKGQVAGPMSEKVARSVVGLDLAEWATRSSCYKDVRHSRLVEIKHCGNETMVAEAPLQVGESGTQPAYVRINHETGRIALDPLAHRYSVTPAQACLEVASELCAREWKATVRAVGHA